MQVEIERLFRAPYSVPNGLQVVDEGLWIVDQITDRVSLMEIESVDPDYGTTKFIRDIPSESANTSGMAFGGGALWLAANGDGSRWRPVRETDPKKGAAEIFEVDPQNGNTLERYPVPGGGGVHGFEYDHVEEGVVWVTHPGRKEMSKVRLPDWTVERVYQLPLERAHGVVRMEDGIWVTFTSDRVIVKLDLDSGEELDRIEVPEPHPQPHGLSLYGEDFIYCDASSGWVAKINLAH